MFLPVFVPDDLYNLQKHVLERLSSTIDSALYYDLIIFNKYLVFLQDHRACPTAVVNCKVKNPLMSCLAAHILKKFFKVFSCGEMVFVKIRDLHHAYYLAALLQENCNANVFGERM